MPSIWICLGRPTDRSRCPLFLVRNYRYLELLRRLKVVGPRILGPPVVVGVDRSPSPFAGQGSGSARAVMVVVAGFETKQSTGILWPAL